jgi:hypothetical protein
MDGLLTKTSGLCKAIVTSEADEAHGFRRINLRSIKVGQKIPFDLYLKYVSASSSRVNYLLGCTKNAVFETAWAKKLEDMGIQWVYFASQDQAVVLRYLATNLRTMLLEDSLEPWDKTVIIHDTMSTWIHLFFTTEKKRTGPLIKLALTLVDDLIGLINDDKNFVEVFLNISRHGEILCTEASAKSKKDCHSKGGATEESRSFATLRMTISAQDGNNGFAEVSQLQSDLGLGPSTKNGFPWDLLNQALITARERPLPTPSRRAA